MKAKDLVDGVEAARKENGGYIWGKSGELWTQKKQDEMNKTTSSDYEQSRLYGSKWIGHHVWDCSGLPYDILRKHGIKISHGSNSIWRYNLSHKGKIVPGMKLPIGAAIFTGDSSKHNHIGTLVTSNYVNEAKGVQAGIVRTALSNKKWTYWGLYKGVEYDFIPGQEDQKTPESDPAEVPVVDEYPLITKGSRKKDAVLLMQALLMKAGYELPKFGADGSFGNETLNALKKFQADHGLKVDGKCGPLTWGELRKFQ